MKFTICSLSLSHTDPRSIVEQTELTRSRNYSAAIADIISEVKKSDGFLLAAARGSGKTSLFNKISFHFNSQVGNVVAIGPLSLRLVAQIGLDSLGSRLRDWILDNESQFPHALPSSFPAHSDSLDAWVPFLKGLISQRNARTLLLLLDDLDSVPPKDRRTTLHKILNSSWGKIAPRTVLGCAGSLAEREVSRILVDNNTFARRQNSFSEVPVNLKRETVEELLNAMIVGLGPAEPFTEKKGSKGYAKGYEDIMPPIQPPIEPVRGGKPQVDEGLAGSHLNVHCTVYAPFEASPGKEFLVQVFAHLAGQALVLEEIAKQAAPDAKKRGSTTLPKEIKRGTELTFNLTMPELEIDEPSQSVIWQLKPALVQFGVRVPKNLRAGDLIGRVEVSESSIPIGRLRFTLKIVTEATASGTEPVPVAKMRRYQQAFISYSSKDRAEVLKRVQMLNALGPRYFMDQVNLEPGAKWEKRLYEYLDESDVVYLFWSKAASRSRWVRKEIRYAKQRQAGNDEAPPDIVPIPIEGPPIVKPPKELSYLHFNDKFLYFINPKAQRR